MITTTTHAKLRALFRPLRRVHKCQLCPRLTLHALCDRHRANLQKESHEIHAETA